MGDRGLWDGLFVVAGAVSDCRSGPEVLECTGGTVVTDISLLESRCEGWAGPACGLLPFGEPADWFVLNGWAAVAGGRGVADRADGEATTERMGTVLRGCAVGTLPSAGWLAVDWPGWEAWLDGVWAWWLAGPGSAAEPIWLKELGCPAAEDGLAAVAWPGMAA